MQCIKLNCPPSLSPSLSLSLSLSLARSLQLSMTFTNSASEEPMSRTTQVVFRQPTNPDLRLRQVVLSDSCSMTAQGIAHNTTLMWGNLLPTQTIALRFIGSRNEAGAGATIKLLNEGRVFGFGRLFTLALGKTRSATDRACTVSSLYHIWAPLHKTYH